MPVIWVERKPEYFCDEGWTGGIRLNCLRKLGCTRRGVERFGQRV
jgi:hypothetical protein